MSPKFPTWLPALAIFAGGVVAMRAAHVGVFADPDPKRVHQRAVEAAAPDGSTTSTTFDLTARVYSPGDCVRWDQDADGPGTRTTRVVPCDQPHLIEITGRTAMPILKSYPTEDEWDRIIDDGDCGKQVAAYLGGEIDPYGRFGVGALRPTVQGWAAGDRQIWCGVQPRAVDAHNDPNVLDSFTGKAQAQPQGFAFPAGTCLAGDTAALMVTGRVGCTEPHIYETVGDVDAGAAFTTPPERSSPAWNQKLGPACTALARKAFGGRMPNGVQATADSIDATSWRTGQRRAECDIARYDANNHPVVLTAPLLPAH